MQIAVLGAGNIGGSIGEQWAQAGHTIRFGVRNPQKPEVQSLVKSLGGKASAASIAEVLNGAEVVLLAIPGSVVADTIKANAQALDGKIVIDATNNMRAAHFHALDVLRAETPKASIYRAFNNYGWENFKNPGYNGEHADLFFCGTDGAARATVEQLIREVGLEPAYLGGADQGDTVDLVLKLWFPLTQSQGRHFGFKIVKS